MSEQGTMVSFSIVTEHVQEARQGDADGRLVLSRMRRGESRCFCATPTIAYVMEGEERYRVDGVEHVVLPGQFLLVEAGVHLEAVIRQPGLTTGMCIYLRQDERTPFVDLRTAEERRAQGTRTSGRAIVLSASGTPLGEHLKRAGRELLRDPDSGSNAADRIVRGASALLQGLMDDVGSQLSNIKAVKADTRRDLLRRLDLARSWLWDNQDRAVPLDELSHVAGLSQLHLLRCFSAAFGAAPATYHRHQRLRQAAHVLRLGHLDTAGAAARYGFSDQRAFRRAMKQLPDPSGSVRLAERGLLDPNLQI
jgi:AraC-like DNA-binding protein